MAPNPKGTELKKNEEETEKAKETEVDLRVPKSMEYRKNRLSTHEQAISEMITPPTGYAHISLLPLDGKKVIHTDFIEEKEENEEGEEEKQ